MWLSPLFICSHVSALVGRGEGVSVGNGRGLANQSIDGTAYAVKTCCKIADEKVPSAHTPPECLVALNEWKESIAPATSLPKLCRF